MYLSRPNYGVTALERDYYWPFSESLAEISFAIAGGIILLLCYASYCSTFLVFYCSIILLRNMLIGGGGGLYALYSQL